LTGGPYLVLMAAFIGIRVEIFAASGCVQPVR